MGNRKFWECIRDFELKENENWKRREERTPPIHLMKQTNEKKS